MAKGKLKYYKSKSFNPTKKSFDRSVYIFTEVHEKFAGKTNSVTFW